MMQELKRRRFHAETPFFPRLLWRGFQTLFRRGCIRKRNGNGEKVFGPFLRGFVECVRFS